MGMEFAGMGVGLGMVEVEDMKIAYTELARTARNPGRQNFFDKYPWILGIIYLILGGFVGTQGIKLFPYVAAIMSGFMVAYVVILVCESIGLTDSDLGYWCTIVAAVIAGAAMAGFIYKRQDLGALVLGTAGGFFAGILLLNIITGISGWQEEWAYFVFAVAGGVGGGFAAHKHRSKTILIVTSFLGAYLCTRGLSFLFWQEHWPSEE